MLLCFSLFCVCCIRNGYGLIQKKCCCLIQMDGIFFVFFLCLMIFFVFLYCLIYCFSVRYVFYGDPEGACLIQMGRG